MLAENIFKLPNIKIANFIDNILDKIKPIKLNYNFLIVAIIGLELLTPLIPLPGKLPAFRISEILIFLLIFAWSLNSPKQANKAEKKFGITKFELYFFMFCLASLVSTFWGYMFLEIPYHYRDFMNIPRFILYWGAFRIGMQINVRHPGNIKYVKFLLYSFILLNIFNFMQFFNFLNFNRIIMPFYATGESVERWAGRILGTGNHINNYAFILLSIIIFYIVCYLYFEAQKSNKISKVFLFFGALATSISFLLVKNRTTFVAGGFAFLYLGLASIGLRNGLRIKRSILKFWMIIIMIVIVLILSVGGGLLSRFSGKRMIGGELSASGTQLRMFLWYMAFNRVMKSPILGFGEQTAERLQSRELDQLAEEGNYSRKDLLDMRLSGELHTLPHSEYLTIWQNFGIAGILFYFAMFISIFKKSYQLNDSEYYLFGLGFRALLIMLAVFNITEVFFYDHQSALVFMLMFGIIYKLSENVTKKRKEAAQWQ
jgi:O-antigen ligase